MAPSKDQESIEQYKKIFELTKVPVKQVNITTRAVMNIITHCRESSSFAGQILGLECDGILEVTYAFPFPLDQEDTESQLDMMRYLREINIDSNNVGWYLSSYNGNHIGVDILESQLSYQSDIKNSVVIIYDPMVTEEGALTLKAYRLKENVISLLKGKVFTKKSLLDNHFSFLDFLEEIPVVLSDNSLTTSMLLTLSDIVPPYEDIPLPNNGYLLKNIEGLVQSINELSKVNSTNFVNWQKNVSKQETLQQQHIAKRKLEIEQLRAKGQTIPEPTMQEYENENPKIFKKPPEPDRYESLLLDYQLDFYCTQINEYLNNNS